MNRLNADLDSSLVKVDPRKMSLYDDYELDGFPDAVKKPEPIKDRVWLEDTLSHESCDDAAIIPTEHVCETVVAWRDHLIQEQVIEYTQWYDSLEEEPPIPEQPSLESAPYPERFSASFHRDSVESTFETLKIDDSPESPSVWKKIGDWAVRPFSKKNNDNEP